MVRFASLLAVVALAAVAGGSTLSAVADSSTDGRTRSEATSVARAFFTTLNRRRYEQTCDLLAEGYLETHRLESASQCALGLRIGFMWSQEIRFRIGRVRIRGGRAFVDAIVDGTPGQLVLGREDGRLKVLAAVGR